MNAECTFEKAGVDFGKIYSWIIGILLLLALATLCAHALEKHAESNPIHQCLEKNGYYQAWVNKTRDTFYLLCQYEPGKWGFEPRDAKSGAVRTAFSRLEGTWKQMIKYFTDNGYTRWTKALPFLP